MILLAAPVALLPVLAFLGLLVALDSFKLVPLPQILRSIGLGCIAALAALVANGLVLQETAVSLRLWSRSGAPVLEEILKALPVIWMLRNQRCGFLADAALHGFALGAGFALLENLHYLRMMPQASLWLWIVRGFGTAVMHGSTTAVFALLSRALTDRNESTALRWFLPGLLAASALHLAYNLFLLPPLASTLVLLTVFPLVLATVFAESEKATRRWLGEGFDGDTALLEQLISGELREGPAGRYLQRMRESFEGAVVADMLCYLQLHVELSLRAKGLLMAKEAGLQLPVGEDVQPKLKEMRWLESSIGPTGRSALRPLLGGGSRDLWQIHTLKG